MNNYGDVIVFLNNVYRKSIKKSNERFWLGKSETTFSEQRKGQQ